MLSNSSYGMTCKEKLSCPLDHIYSKFPGKQEKLILIVYRWKQVTEASLPEYEEENLISILIKEHNMSLFLRFGLSAFSVFSHIYKKLFQRENGCIVLNK